MKDFLELRAGDDLDGRRVVSAGQWTWPDGRGVREVQVEFPSPPGARRMVVAPSFDVPGEPRQYRALHYVPNASGSAEGAARADLLSWAARVHGLAGEPLPGGVS